MIDFNAQAATWDDDPAKRDRALRVAAAIEREVALTPDTRGLEYGCGTGLVGFALAPHVGSLVLADSSPGMLEVLRRKIEATGAAAGHLTAMQLDLLGDPLPAERFDLVFTSMVLHHVRDVPRVLDAFARLLVPGGSLCIADLDAEDGSFHGPDVTDVHRGFERGWLQGQLQATGLVDVRFSTLCEIHKETAAGERTFPVFFVACRTPR